LQIKIKHIVWLLNKGKALERACEFSSALKYYFAGNMYFSRLSYHQALSTPVSSKTGNKEQASLNEEFRSLYFALLPMTNAEVPTISTAFEFLLEMRILYSKKTIYF
jgi:hypothetical protein